MKTLIVPETRKVLQRIAVWTLIGCLMPAALLAAVLQGWKCEALPSDVATSGDAEGLPCSEDLGCSSRCDKYQYQPTRRGNCVQTGNPNDRCNQQQPVQVEQRVYAGGA